MYILNRLFGDKGERKDTVIGDPPTGRRVETTTRGTLTLRILELEADDRQYCKRYEVYDKSLSEVVFVGSPVYCGEHIGNGNLVAVRDYRVYTLPKGSTHKWNLTTIDSTEVRFLSKAEVFRAITDDANYLHAIGYFAMDECLQYISHQLTNRNEQNG